MILAFEVISAFIFSKAITLNDGKQKSAHCRLLKIRYLCFEYGVRKKSPDEKDSVKRHSSAVRRSRGFFCEGKEEQQDA